MLIDPSDLEGLDLDPAILEQVEEELRILERTENITKCLSADNLKSRATEAQDSIFKAKQTASARYYYILGGNQCLLKGTLVMTAKGPKPIEDIQVGDYVYSEFREPIKVLKTYRNGLKPVRKLTSRGVTYAVCTSNHQWLTQTYSRKTGKLLNQSVRTSSALEAQDSVVRNTLMAPLGDVREDHAYAIAAFLGDGCSRTNSANRLYISSQDKEVPEKVAKILNTKCVPNPHNYTWAIHTGHCNYYEEWCKDRYAHEKTCDLDIIKSWDRHSLLNFVAGLLDTDGTVYPNNDHISLGLGMQAKPVIDAFAYAVLALWQIQLHRGEDTRSKYKNGNLHIAYTRDSRNVQYILEELDSFMVTTSRKWKSEYVNIGRKRTREGVVHLKYDTEEFLGETYDIHVQSPTNLYCLANGLVTHNSGKTSVNVRELVWMIEETHPYWKKFNSLECNCGNKNITKFGHETVPTYSCKECGNSWKDWGTNPINFILCGENRTNIILNLWTRIEPLLLEPEKWKKLMIGSVHAGFQHRETKNSLLFFPHGQGEEKTRKAVQGFTYHGAFLDELPGPAVIEELQRRVDAQMGFFQAAFTMKTINHDTLRFMNGQVKSGAALIFKLSKLDNPVNAGRREEEMAKLAGLPKSKQDQILYGDVEASSEKIFQYLYEDVAITELPSHYSPMTWEHYEWIDPADTHKACWSLFAQDPQTDNWYWVRCEIIENIKSPKALCLECMKFATNYNITFRGADDHKWFISTMKEEFGLIYKVPKGKRRGRFVKAKVDMIKFAQTFLDSNRFQILDKLEGVFGELSDFRWKNEDKGDIVNPHRFHRLDTFIYFVDGLPKHVKEEMEISGPITEAERRRRIKEYNRNKTLAKDHSPNPRKQFVFLKGLTSRLGKANILGQSRRRRR